MKRLAWFERQFTFGLSPGMLPFYLERLEGTFSRITEKVKGYSDDALSTRLDDKWSVKQNIGHLAEVDQIADKRIDEMIAGITPLSPAVFEPGQDYNKMPVEKVLAYFKTTRERNIAKYHNLRDEELAKSSLHPRLKLNMTPVDLAWFDAEHDDHHIVTISEILKKIQALKPQTSV